MCAGRGKCYTGRGQTGESPHIQQKLDTEAEQMALPYTGPMNCFLAFLINSHIALKDEINSTIQVFIKKTVFKATWIKTNFISSEEIWLLEEKRCLKGFMFSLT